MYQPILQVLLIIMMCSAHPTTMMPVTTALSNLRYVVQEDALAQDSCIDLGMIFVQADTGAGHPLLMHGSPELRQRFKTAWRTAWNIQGLWGASLLNSRDKLLAELFPDLNEEYKMIGASTPCKPSGSSERTRTLEKFTELLNGSIPPS